MRYDWDKAPEPKPSMVDAPGILAKWIVGLLKVCKVLSVMVDAMAETMETAKTRW